MDPGPPKLDYAPAGRTRPRSPALQAALNVLFTLAALGVVALLAVAAVFVVFAGWTD